MKNKQVTLNIGLNNNPYKFNEVMSVIRGAYPNAEGREAVGEWEGADEPTAVIRFDIPKGERMMPMATFMCEVFTQTAIGMKEGGVGALVYRPDHDGERYEFSDEYFIEFEPVLIDIIDTANEFNSLQWASDQIIKGEFIGFDHDGEITYTDPYGGHQVTVSGEFEYTNDGWIHTFTSYGKDFIVVANKVN